MCTKSINTIMELDLCQLKAEVEALNVACGHLFSRVELAEKLLEKAIAENEVHIALLQARIARLKKLILTVRRTPETIA